jgi:hypothetical protein
MQMGVLSRYDQYPELRQASAIDLVAAAWLGCNSSITDVIDLLSGLMEIIKLLRMR